jgi:hypothetical protein
MNYQPGDTVLVRGVVGRDGVVLGPGVEVGQRCLDIVGDMPVFNQANQPVAMLLFFADESSMRQFAERISDDPDVDVRLVESADADD